MSTNLRCEIETIKSELDKLRQEGRNAVVASGLIKNLNKLVDDNKITLSDSKLMLDGMKREMSQLKNIFSSQEQELIKTRQEIARLYELKKLSGAEVNVRADRLTEELDKCMKYREELRGQINKIERTQRHSDEVVADLSKKFDKFSGVSFNLLDMVTGGKDDGETSH